MQRRDTTGHEKRRAGFSLVELVVVVIIIGILGAIAIPRLSRGAQGAKESAVVHNEAVLTKAVELYKAEHGGQYPDPVLIDGQLTQYTDFDGNVSATKTTTHIFGPYLRQIPEAPLDEEPGDVRIGTEGLNDAGWLLDRTTGDVRFNPAYTAG